MRKKKKKTTNMNMVILFSILALLVIIIAIALVIYNFTRGENEEQDQNKQEERKAEYVRLDTVHPMEFEKFMNEYTGDVPKEYILEIITNFIYYFMDHKQELDDIKEENIVQYYNDNKDTINDLGIMNENDFKNIVNTIKGFSTTELEFSYVQIKTDTIIKTGLYTIAELELKYTNMNPMNIEIRIQNTYDESNEVVTFLYNE